LTASTVIAWMKKLDTALKMFNYLLSLIFNMDEIMIDVIGRKVKVISQAKGGHSFSPEEAKLEHISLDLCVSTTGRSVQPLCILFLKTLLYLDPSILNYYFYSGQQNRFIDNDI
jgi:hypothetical protein